MDGSPVDFIVVPVVAMLSLAAWRPGHSSSCWR